MSFNEKKRLQMHNDYPIKDKQIKKKKTNYKFIQ